jgi:phosphoribosylanthranilate isomerase
MTKFKVKVCGITRPADAQLASRLGADMIGMIFYKKSPRCVTLKQARDIIAVLPPVVDRVGVFVNEDFQKMLRIAGQLRLDYVQLSGDEPARMIAAIRKHGLKVIKSYQVVSASDYDELFRSRADLVMLDNRTESAYGGTGRTFDWGCKPPRLISNLVLAGGITAENVATGVELFRPLVVDVNSGVESSAGIKSADKLKQFFNQCDKLRYVANKKKTSR